MSLLSLCLLARHSDIFLGCAPPPNPRRAPREAARATLRVPHPLAHGAVRGRGSRAAPRRAAFSSGWSRMVLELAAAWRGYVPPHHGLDVDFVL